MNKKEWDKIRKKVLKRDNFRCRGNVAIVQRCSEKATDIHHIIPKKDGGSDTPQNLVSLCKKHHLIADNTFKKYGLTRIAKIWLEENRDDTKKE